MHPPISYVNANLRPGNVTFILIVPSGRLNELAWEARGVPADLKRRLRLLCFLVSARFTPPLLWTILAPTFDAICSIPQPTTKSNPLTIIVRAGSR